MINLIEKIISVAAIESNPFQPRLVLDEKAISQLAETVKSVGLLNPPMVRPHPEVPGRYQLVHGERRLRAVKMLGWEEVNCVVNDLSDEGMIKVSLVENLQRENLNPLEEAQGIQELREKLGLSLTEAARTIGKSRPYISNSLRLLEMPFFLRACVLCKTLTAWHARVIMGLPDGYEKYRVADLVMDWYLSVAETREIVTDIKAGAMMVSWLRDVPVDALEVWRSRGYSSDEVARMTDLMTEKGLKEPVAVLADGRIIDGVLRVQVAKALGWEKIRAWVFFYTDWLRFDMDGVIYFPNGRKGQSRSPPLCQPMSDEYRRRMHRLNEMLKTHIRETPGSPARWPVLRVSWRGS